MHALQAKREEQDKENTDYVNKKLKSIDLVKHWEGEVAKLESELKVKAEQIEKSSRAIETANRRLQRVLLERGPDVHTGKIQILFLPILVHIIHIPLRKHKYSLEQCMNILLKKG